MPACETCGKSHPANESHQYDLAPDTSNEFRDCLTHELLEDPVEMQCGHVVSRRHTRKIRHCPACRQPAAGQLKTPCVNFCRLLEGVRVVCPRGVCGQIVPKSELPQHLALGCLAAPGAEHVCHHSPPCTLIVHRCEIEGPLHGCRCRKIECFCGEWRFLAGYGHTCEATRRHYQLIIDPLAVLINVHLRGGPRGKPHALAAARYLCVLHWLGPRFDALQLPENETNEQHILTQLSHDSELWRTLSVRYFKEQLPDYFPVLHQPKDVVKKNREITRDILDTLFPAACRKTLRERISHLFGSTPAPAPLHFEPVLRPFGALPATIVSGSQASPAALGPAAGVRRSRDDHRDADHGEQARAAWNPRERHMASSNNNSNSNSNSSLNNSLNNSSSTNSSSNSSLNSNNSSTNDPATSAVSTTGGGTIVGTTAALLTKATSTPTSTLAPASAASALVTATGALWHDARDKVARFARAPPFLTAPFSKVVTLKFLLLDDDSATASAALSPGAHAPAHDSSTSGKTTGSPVPSHLSLRPKTLMLSATFDTPIHRLRELASIHFNTDLGDLMWNGVVLDPASTVGQHDSMVDESEIVCRAL